ncbi:ABC transporter ATP-binding protein/permease [Halomonas sp. DP8Y7-3]|uniref:ABC transporter ATP-binding protein n=1 Tax=Halomonas sp. DP8Y7-3 TaxID=2859079 RepID=UPI001C9738B3|nr:ABC transporter ATP-binding protein [Halomonas sp. DP8Y7-3]MBY5927925.1 ABC transporter ATP-binding protein/permease [Halomonas sp. DP8Y7-3]
MLSFFERLVDPYPDQPESVPTPQLWPFILHYSRPFAGLLLSMALVTALVSAAEVVFFTAMGELVDWLAEADRTRFVDTHLMALVGLGVAVLVGLPLLVLVLSLITHQGIFGNYPMLGRWLSHRLMLNQSLSFFHDEFAGRVSQKVMQTALAMRETVTKLLDMLVYVLVYFTGALVVLGSAEPWLMVPLLVWLGGYLGLMRWFIPRLRRVSMAQADARAVMTGRVVDSYSNIQTIKLFADDGAEQAYAREAMDGFMGTVHRQMRLATGLSVALTMLNTLLLVAMAALVVLAWYHEWVSLGVTAVAIGLVMRVRSMSDWILWEVAGLFENIGTVQDGINTLSKVPEVQDQPGAPRLVVSRGKIVFDHITFGYARGQLPGRKVFDGFELQIAPGERVGIIGRSGAGKSTLASLLLRFHDVQDGRILVDDQDIAGVSQSSLRQQIGMVTQDTSLLHRSLRENVLYGSQPFSEERLWQALRQAHVHEFLDELVDPQGRRGLDAQVGERGVTLSGGQRQRIAIARVLLKDAPILVLDEATSALDSEVESAIQEQLYTLMEGKTVIAIAHRLSTIAMLDRLVVIDRGRIVEMGDHHSLLAQDGLYASLWQRQAGGFLGE